MSDQMLHTVEQSATPEQSTTPEQKTCDESTAVETAYALVDSYDLKDIASVARGVRRSNLKSLLKARIEARKATIQ